MSHKSSRAIMVGLIATLLAGLVAVPVAATTAKITGTLVLPADVSGPGTGAIAVITLIDATNTSDSGNIIGEQRIDGIGATPVAFAVGVTLAPGADSLVVLMDVDSGASLGMDLTSPTKLPAPFAIPFAVSDLKSNGAYVVQAELTSDSQTWANAAGVPVITNGNPLSGVQVVVAEVAQPTPSPTATPTIAPTPAPSPAPEPDSGLGGGGLLLPIIIIAGLILVGGFLLARSKDDEPTPPSAPSEPPAPEHP